jgi:hypothetical protein
MRNGLLLHYIDVRAITDPILSNDSVSWKLKLAQWPPYLLTVEPLSVSWDREKVFSCEGRETCGTGCALLSLSMGIAQSV